MKKPLHSFGQRGPKCTPIFGLSPKKFLRKFIPSPIPTGRGQMHPLNGKIFPNEKPPHSFGQRGPKCTPIFGLSSKNFLRKFISSLVPTGKYQIIGCFWKIFYLVKSPLTYLELRSRNAPCFSEKKQKNLPANIGGHTFNTKNIIGLLKYSERIHIGWIIRQKVL